MDIAGAKALKERLGNNGKDAEPAPAADIREDAPPVYHYLGVSETPAADPPTGDDHRAPAARRFSWLRRLSRPRG